MRHWVGVLILALAVGGAAFVLPPLISSTGPAAPAPGSSSAGPQAAGPLAPPVVSPEVAAPSAAPGSKIPTRGTAASPTAGSTGLPGSAPRPAATSKPAKTRSTGPGVAAPSPTKAAGGSFTPLKIQAENASLLEGTQAIDCDACGGGQRVRYLGRVEARFNVPTSGTRTITVACTVGDTFRELSVTVNGKAVLTEERVEGDSWEKVLSVSARTSVPAGPVTVAVFGAPNGPDIDAISIS